MIYQQEKPELERVFDLLPYISGMFKERPVFGNRQDDRWITISVNEYIRTANDVSYSLLASGIRKGDKVVTISRNRPEMNMVDMGILQIGAVHVPLYPGIPDHKLEKILEETACKVLFLSGSSLVKKVLPMRIGSPDTSKIISFEPCEGAMLFREFTKLGSDKGNPAELESARSGVNADDPAIIVYISGATTPVKGVVLTHRNLVSNIKNYAQLPHFRKISASISFLPLAHSFERIINYCQQYFGLTVWYNERIPDMMRDFRELKPEMAVMVPLLVERLFKSLVQQSTQKGLLAKPNEFVIEKAKMVQPGSFPGFTARLILLYARIVFFRHWRKALGGRLKFILCGGAALNHEYLNLAFAMGVPIYEGYGITEAGPLVSYNTGTRFKAYSVGKAMPGVRIRIAKDMEVLVKSEGIMKSYYHQPVDELSVIDHDGWLHTGDLGMLDEDGFLTLTGIKKDLFKLSSGIYVNPAAIEQKLKASSRIEQVWIYGHNRPFLCAFIIPVNGDNDSPTGNEAVEKEIREEIRAYNSVNKGPDQIVRFTLVKDQWSVENGLVKDDGSLNRQNLYQFYEPSILMFYAKL